MKIIFAIAFLWFATAEADVIPTKRFIEIGEDLRKVYEPLARKENAEFKMIWKPNDRPVLNATGIKQNGAWEVTAYGGLMYHPLMTEEALRFILCHEIGHMIGGEPTFPVAGPDGRTSNSGQPDYYAAAVCMKLLLQNSNNSTERRLDPVIYDKCGRNFKTQRERNLCARIANAGYEAMKFISTFYPGSHVSFSTPSTLIVSKMDWGHPDPQCRLDTAFAGALCQATPTGNSVEEANAMNAKCNVGESARPRCWFAPQ